MVDRAREVLRAMEHFKRAQIDRWQFGFQQQIRFLESRHDAVESHERPRKRLCRVEAPDRDRTVGIAAGELSGPNHATGWDQPYLPLDDRDDVGGNLSCRSRDRRSQAGRLDRPSPGALWNVKDEGPLLQRERAGAGIEGKDGVLADADERAILVLQLGAGVGLGAEVVVGSHYISYRRWACSCPVSANFTIGNLVLHFGYGRRRVRHRSLRCAEKNHPKCHGTAEHRS